MGLRVSNCSFYKMGCGAKIVCVGGILHNSLISNNLVRGLPEITGDVEPDSTSFFADNPWTSTAMHSGKHPADWFFKFCGKGHGWQDGVFLGFGSDEHSDSVAFGSGCAEIGTIINVND